MLVEMFNAQYFDYDTASDRLRKTAHEIVIEDLDATLDRIGKILNTPE